MFGRNKAPQGLSESRTPGKIQHSVVMTGECANTRCRASLSVPHSFDAVWGWSGEVKDTVTCSCGTSSSVSAHSG